MGLVLTGRVLRGRRVVDGAVCVVEGAVCATAEGERRAMPDGWLVCPGFVDLQVNGFGGAQVGEPGGVAAVARALPAAGVTAFCPTLVTRSATGYRRAASALREAPAGAPAARALGLHLEGPFLAPSRRGAHSRAALREPTTEAVDQLLGAFAPAIVTLAPELPGAMAAIRRIARSGCVAAIGHTDADAALGREAIGAGARLATHALNAMRGIESRRPSALTAFIGDPRTHVSLIADGVHVAPEVAAVLARALGPRLVLVSDAVAAAGAPAGRHPLGARTSVSDGVSVRIGGRLAGSVTGLDAGPATLVGAGIAVADALAAATSAPRRLLGLGRALGPGTPADLVVLDETLAPRLTLVGGRVAFVGAGLPFAVPALGAPV